MNVLIVGYGSMGKEVEKVLLARNHAITSRVDIAEGIGDTKTISDKLLTQSEVIIEFSLSDGLTERVRRYAEKGVPAVIGTTGWEAERENVKSIIEKHGSALLWGPNFSIGAQLFIRIVREASKLIDPVPDYDVMMYELHHSNKKDSPSGTALRIGETILGQVERKNTITTERLDRKVNPEELHIGSVRGGSIPGVHTVLFDSAADSIEMKHTARNRGGFALGAVMAAEWVRNKTGFYSVDDFLNSIF